MNFKIKSKIIFMHVTLEICNCIFLLTEMKCTCVVQMLYNCEIFNSNQIHSFNFFIFLIIKENKCIYTI